MESPRLGELCTLITLLFFSYVYNRVLSQAI